MNELNALLKQMRDAVSPDAIEAFTADYRRKEREIERLNYRFCAFDEALKILRS